MQLQDGLKPNPSPQTANPEPSGNVRLQPRTRRASKSTPANVQCQKCLQKDKLACDHLVQAPKANRLRTPLLLQNAKPTRKNARMLQGRLVRN